jgi:hypothetical protein
MTGSRVSIGAQGVPVWLTVTRLGRDRHWSESRSPNLQGVKVKYLTVAITCGHTPWAAADPDSDCGTPAAESELPPGGCPPASHGTASFRRVDTGRLPGRVIAGLTVTAAASTQDVDGSDRTRRTCTPPALPVSESTRRQPGPHWHGHSEAPVAVFERTRCSQEEGKGRRVPSGHRRV